MHYLNQSCSRTVAGIMAWPATLQDVPTKKSPCFPWRSGQADLTGILRDPSLRILKTHLLERLFLEIALGTILVKLVLFVAYFTLFYCSLQTLLPASEASAARRVLEGVSETEKVKFASSREDVFEYATQFADAMEKLRPTHQRHWCREPYLSTEWDRSTEAPRRVCNETPFASGQDQELQQASGRRLQAQANTTASTLPACRDENANLALSLNDENATCQSYSSTICDLDAGTLYCPMTCGICTATRLRTLQEFIGPTLALTPMVIFQKRFATQTYCDPWLEARQAEVAATEPVFSSFFEPMVKVTDHGESFGLCVDRNMHQETRNAFIISCPTDAGSHCKDGDPIEETPSRTFRSETIYAHAVFRPAVDLARLQAIEWLDYFTDTVTLSVLTYTEGLDVFSVFALEFAFDIAGNVVSKIKISPLKDLSGSGEDVTLSVCIAFLIVVVLFALAETVYHARCTGAVFSKSFHIFDFTIRVLLLVAAIALPFMSSGSRNANDIKDKFKDASSAFLAIDSPSGGTINTEQALDAFFNAADSLLHHDDLQLGFAVAYYVVLLLLLLQLGVYLHYAHPRLARNGVWRSVSCFLHFAMLLFFLFLGFAFMLHELLGRSSKVFETFGQTMKSMLQSIYGDFFFSDSSRLDSDTATLDWICAIMFSLVFFYFARFVVLTIIIHSFSDAENTSPSSLPQSNLISDVLDVAIAPFRISWPSRNALSHALLSMPSLIRPDEFLNPFSVDRVEAKPFVDFIAYMHARCPHMLSSSPASSSHDCCDDMLWFADDCCDELHSREHLELLSTREDRIPQHLSRASETCPEKVGNGKAQSIAEVISNKILVEMAKSEQINWLSMTSRVTGTLYSELLEHNLIVGRKQK